MKMLAYKSIHRVDSRKLATVDYAAVNAQCCILSHLSQVTADNDLTNSQDE